MRRPPKLPALAIAVSGLALATLAGPSAADTSTVTVTVSAGSLSVDAPATVSAGGSLASTLNVDVTGITVDDDRGSLAGWTATATMTDLITDDGADPGETIAATSMLWTTTSITPEEGQVAIALPGAGAPDAGAVMAVGLPALSPGLFTIDGQLTVPIPVDVLAGAFTGTLTTTVS